MAYSAAVRANETILGIEGGGTKTAWAMVKDGRILDGGKLPPSNLRLTPAKQLARILRSLPRDPDRVGVFLAGCVTDEDRAALGRLANEIWPKARIVLGSDRDSGLAACLGQSDGIVVNAGTGSSVTGRRAGQIEKAGGWGHILGDTGGAYFVSIRALRLILRDYDLRRGNRKFAANVLAALALNNFDELVRWAQTADKTDIAAIAPFVFAAAAEGDEPVRRIISASATALSDFAAAVATRLQWPAPKVRLMGGLFENQPGYAHAFEKVLRERMPNADVAVATTAPELGAAWLAAEGDVSSPLVAQRPSLGPAASTEKANPKSEGLEKLSARELVELFAEEEKCVAQALRAKADELARAIELAGETLRNRGRMFYVGAGTSGRLGALDAAEIPPTFGTPRDSVQAIIAGGARALQQSIEGAEDDEASGELAMDERNVTVSDLVIGISASGHAPFVLAALRRARAIGARTILLTCNPAADHAGGLDLLIDLPTGSEILAGSTRLKAGTATKLALNIISTGAMARLGRVRGNLMIDLQPTNKKLRARAVRLVSHLSGCDEETARARLQASGWNVRAALKE
jgi:N-acetylmuramic acid 6-phosphate etherase